MTPARLIRISHPYLWHHPGDLIDTLDEASGITTARARELIRSGYAVDVTPDLEGPNDGGWYSYTTPAGEEVNARSLEDLIAELTTPPDIRALDTDLEELEEEEELELGIDYGGDATDERGGK